MGDVTGQGRTVLFVSHNLPSLKSICKTGILLREGRLLQSGNIKDVIDTYTSFHHRDGKITDGIHYFQNHISVRKVSVNGIEHNSVLVESDRLLIILEIEFKKRTAFELDVHLKKDEQVVVSYANFVKSDLAIFEARVYRIEYNIRLPELRSGKYKLDLFFTEPFTSWFAISENMIDVEILNSNHHIFLNSNTLKWGSVLAEGAYSRQILALEK